MTFFVVFVDVLPKLGALVLFYYLHSISPLADIVQRQWWAWVLLFFLDDFAYYCMHRANHEVRLFRATYFTDKLKYIFLAISTSSRKLDDANSRL